MKSFATLNFRTYFHPRKKDYLDLHIVYFFRVMYLKYLRIHYKVLFLFAFFVINFVWENKRVMLLCNKYYLLNYLKGWKYDGKNSNIDMMQSAVVIFMRTVLSNILCFIKNEIRNLRPQEISIMISIISFSPMGFTFYILFFQVFLSQTSSFSF